MLVLRPLTAADEAAFLDGVTYWDGEPLTWYTFDWKPGLEFRELLSRLERNAAGIDLKPGHVPGTMLYGFVGNDIVGRVSVRHELNPFLLHRGGHIGYAVAPRFRGRGYATEMVRQSLDFCRTIKLAKILVTCADDNVASWKIIEKFGGVLENTVHDDDDELIRRYWIRVEPQR